MDASLSTLECSSFTACDRSCPLHEETASTASTQGCLKYRTQADSLRTAYGQSSVEGLEKKQVGWADVSVHLHAVRLGDNPAVSVGPPLTISWKAFESSKFALDEYESTKPQPRGKQEMLLPRFVREDWLRDEGFSRSDITAALKLVNQIKENRKKSFRDGCKCRFFNWGQGGKAQKASRDPESREVAA